MKFLAICLVGCWLVCTAEIVLGSESPVEEDSQENFLPRAENGKNNNVKNAANFLNRVVESVSKPNEFSLEKLKNLTVNDPQISSSLAKINLQVLSSLSNSIGPFVKAAIQMLPSSMVPKLFCGVTTVDAAVLCVIKSMVDFITEVQKVFPFV